MVLQQAMMDADGIPIDVADNLPLIEATPLVIDQVMLGGHVIDVGYEICMADVPRTNVFIPCGNIFFSNCANQVEI
jgi:hypothetical protein